MTRALIFCMATALALTFINSVNAHSHKVKHQKHPRHVQSLGELSISKAWARATPGKARNGAAYISISNATKTTDRLKIVKGNVAERIEIHTHLMDNGVMRMRQIDGVDLPAGGTIEMKPGGYHVMLIGLSRPLKKGGLFPLTLVFEKAGEVITQVKILSVGAMDGGEKQNKSSYGHHKHH